MNSRFLGGAILRSHGSDNGLETGPGAVSPKSVLLRPNPLLFWNDVLEDNVSVGFNGVNSGDAGKTPVGQRALVGYPAKMQLCDGRGHITSHVAVAIANRLFPMKKQFLS
jgi:hypothetical protein